MAPVFIPQIIQNQVKFALVCRASALLGYGLSHWILKRHLPGQVGVGDMVLA